MPVNVAKLQRLGTNETRHIHLLFKGKKGKPESYRIDLVFDQLFHS